MITNKPAFDVVYTRVSWFLHPFISGEFTDDNAKWVAQDCRWLPCRPHEVNDTDRGKKTKATVFLEDVADMLEETWEHWTQYLNTATGECVSLSDGAYVEIDEELAEEIDSSRDYVRLPGQREINEYEIMEDFAEATINARKSERLFRALNGRKPFRTFKDTLADEGLEEAYYAFRFLAFIEIAKEWCEDNDIPYTTRGKK